MKHFLCFRDGDILNDSVVINAQMTVSENHIALYHIHVYIYELLY